MFRRRMARPRGRGAGPMPHPRLQRANELMAIEDYIGAARAFEELANAAILRKGPAAPHLFLQAGRANIKAGNIQKGLTQFERGLKLFADSGEWLKFQRNRNRMVAELHSAGLEDEAHALGHFLGDQLPSELKSTEDELQFKARPVARARATLPTNCPGCGAPMRIDEVDWIDEYTAECLFCGSITRNQ